MTQSKSEGVKHGCSGTSRVVNRLGMFDRISERGPKLKEAETSLRLQLIPFVSHKLLSL